MLPKKIHYCWFGKNSLPELAIKCIDSWKKYFPGYEIIEWNESNYDVHKILYTREAYEVKKYAFVSDYARFDILYQYGGIYFDTDVEVIKPFEDIIQNGGFMGFEGEGKVASGLGIGCNAGLGIINQILQLYKSLNFIKDDGTYNYTTVVEYVTNILIKNGLKCINEIQKLDGITVYPIEYFAPKSIITGKLNITENTYSIHHYDASWIPEYERKYYEIKRKVSNIIGRKLTNVITFPYYILINIKYYGFNKGIKIIKGKFKNAA